MQQPPEFADPQKPAHDCLLKKALYGLKDFLLSNHFVPSQADHFLYIYTTGKTIIYLLVYVDDIVVTGNNPVSIASLKTILHNTFSIKDLDDL
jgi:Reverse transcriptase (RNA-dependent DNA polymerase)